MSSNKHFFKKSNAQEEFESELWMRSVTLAAHTGNFQIVDLEYILVHILLYLKLVKNNIKFKSNIRGTSRHFRGIAEFD